jgi:hypothetical protein
VVIKMKRREFRLPVGVITRSRLPTRAKISMLLPAYLFQKLDRSLPTKDGGTLRTIRKRAIT